MGVCLVILSKYTCAQNGLEKIIVEKYYVSDAADATASIGVLPVGSVTYRIFADMLPGYKFQAIYGVVGHEFRIETNTSFFNNEDRGKKIPSYTKVGAKDNTVMLDTWLSIGAGCLGNYGVLKSEDNGVLTVVNNDGILQNNDPSAGIPLTLQDGLLSGIPEEEVALVGFDGNFTALQLFDSASSVGNLFTTFDASIASLNGSVGPTASNRVLIAQLTTDGLLSFELNIQIGTPSGSVQNFVAKNPVGNEIQLPSLTFNPVLLNLKAFIQGFYIGGGLMNPVIDPTNFPSLCDTVKIELHSSVGPHDLAYSVTKPLSVSGDAQILLPGEVLGNTYYIAIRHRNSIETWSKDPVLFSQITDYDFTTSASKAFGDNEVEAFDLLGWTIFSGDINQDGAIDGSDFLEFDGPNQAGAGGYEVADLNGDGAVDGSDFLIFDPNNQGGVGSSIP